MAEPLKTVSIAFEDAYGHESVALFSMYDGVSLINNAVNYALANEDKEISSAVLMFKFCQSIKSDASEYYLAKSGEDGINVHFNHHVVNILTGKEREYCYY